MMQLYTWAIHTKLSHQRLVCVFLVFCHDHFALCVFPRIFMAFGTLSCGRNRNSDFKTSLMINLIIYYIQYSLIILQSYKQYKKSVFCLTSKHFRVGKYILQAGGGSVERAELHLALFAHLKKPSHPLWASYWCLLCCILPPNPEAAVNFIIASYFQWYFQ